jgi:hypothetical protein
MQNLEKFRSATLNRTALFSGKLVNGHGSGYLATKRRCDLAAKAEKTKEYRYTDSDDTEQANHTQVSG